MTPSNIDGHWQENIANYNDKAFISLQSYADIISRSLSYAKTEGILCVFRGILSFLVLQKYCRISK